eukprot:1258447-Prymnesium_polylepis.1
MATEQATCAQRARLTVVEFHPIGDVQSLRLRLQRLQQSRTEGVLVTIHICDDQEALCAGVWPGNQGTFGRHPVAHTIRHREAIGQLEQALPFSPGFRTNEVTVVAQVHDERAKDCLTQLRIQAEQKLNIVRVQEKVAWRSGIAVVLKAAR